MSAPGSPVSLRPIQDSDSALIVAWRNSEFVRPNFIYQEDFTVEGQLAWIETKVRTGQVAQFIIEETTDTDDHGGGAPTPVGSVFIRDIDTTHRRGEFGIFLGEPRFAGRGIGAAATALILDHGFDVLGLNRIFLRVLATNVRAIASYERTGFRHEGVLRQDVLLRGVYHDVVLMSVLATERR
jgi:RimJ/RimL family protein N-acetyltransferase